MRFSTFIHFRKVPLLGVASAGLIWQLAFGGSQFAAKILWRCVQQPLGIHQTQVSHVAAGGVQKLVEDDVRRLGLEQDGGGMNRHRLVGVQS